MTVRFVHGKSVKKIGVQLEKEKLGKKWICPTTGKKFYDLNKEPVKSPYTGELLEIKSTEDLEKEKTEENIPDTNNKETSQISETDDVKDTDNAESDVEILDDSSEDSIPEIEDDNFSDDSEDSDSNIDELEEFEIDEEIDDDIENDEFLEDNDDNSVEDVIVSVKKNNEEVYGGYSAAGRALASHARGRRFEPA